MIPPPTITDAARAHLDGRPLVVRTSLRHGCCGGRAVLSVAEPGPPRDPDGYRSVDADGVQVYLDRRLDDPAERWDGPWRVDVDGLWRWRRLVVLDASTPSGPTSG